MPGASEQAVERAIEVAIDELRGATAAKRRREDILRRDSSAGCGTGTAQDCDSERHLPALLVGLKPRQAERERYKRLLLELDVTSRIGRSEIRRLELEIRHHLADFSRERKARKTADVNPGLGNITKFLKHGDEKLNEIEMVAPTVGSRTGAVPRRLPLAVSAVSSFVPV